jgi:hypothetical protein
MAGDYRGKEGLAQLFQRQLEILDSSSEIENQDILANDDHAVILNHIKGRQDHRGLAAVLGSADDGRDGLVLIPRRAGPSPFSR